MLNLVCPVISGPAPTPKTPFTSLTSCHSLRLFDGENDVRISKCVQRNLSPLFESKIFRRRHNAKGVGVAHATPPALHADNGITLAKHTEFDSVHDTPLQTAVNILLPWRAVEIGFGLREVKGINTAVKVRILCNH